MFPIVNSNNPETIIKELEEHMGVFISDPYAVAIGKELFEKAKKVFDSKAELPVLDEKTMFPNSVNTLPEASRKVIQRYFNRPFQIPDIDSITYIVSDFSKIITNNILSVAKGRYNWSEQLLSDLLLTNEWSLNIANYPFTKGKEGKLLFPAHKDWGLMAIYPYVDGEGLEIAIDGKWQPVSLPGGCMFCYAGDIFSRVTNNKIKALVHRVVQPITQASDRTSIIFYADPIRSMVLPDGTVINDVIDAKLKQIGQIK